MARDTARSSLLLAAFAVVLAGVVLASAQLLKRGGNLSSHVHTQIVLCSQGSSGVRPEIPRPEIPPPDVEVEFPGPRGRIIGCGGGNSRHIVFVCDASASMAGKIDLLKATMCRAIAKLRGPQTFDIIFFRDGKAVSFSRDEVHLDSMLEATTEMKRRASAFIDGVEISGGSDPSEALRVGLLRQPHVLYLLSDGNFPDDDAVRAKVSELNKPKPDGARTRVNAIAFLGDDEESPLSGETLWKIAEEQQGYYFEITEDDLAQ